MQRYGLPTLGIRCGIGRIYASDDSGVVSLRNGSGTVFGGYGQVANMHSCKSFGPDRNESGRSDPYCLGICGITVAFHCFWSLAFVLHVQLQNM